MKILLPSLALMIAGVVLFILDDIAAITVDYHITLLVFYCGLIGTVFHLFITSDE